MSHEIRTPLTGILGFAKLLAESATGNQREFVQHIQDGGERLLGVLNSVLDLSKIESGGRLTSNEVCVIAKQVEKTLGLLMPLAIEKNITLRAEITTENSSVIADRSGVYRVLDNLIGNAIKFTDSGGVVVVVQDSSTVKNGIDIVVSDTGIGVEEKFIRHLFDPFKQESSGTSRTHGGVGLGLSITKRLVEIMGGG